jgi:hypothetical protein
MTPEQMVAAVQKYDTQLAEGGFEPNKLDDTLERPTAHQSLEHVRWMCQQVPGFVAAGQLEKVNRWLGWIQGTLHAHGVGSIASFKDDNR